jgi:Lon protease-like protein
MSYRDALANLPLFPLPRTTLFPGLIIPLHIFEPRYQTLIADCMASHRSLALVTIDEHASMDGASTAGPAICAVGCVGEILKFERMLDGRSNLLLEGKARVRLEELAFKHPYRRARAEELATIESKIGAVDHSALLALSERFARMARKVDSRFDVVLPTGGPHSALADFIAGHFLVQPEEQQKALEMLDVAERVRFIIDALSAQVAFASSREGEGFGALN